MTFYSDLSDAIERGESDLITGWAARVLDDVTGGRRALRAVNHPLGFVCLPVHRSGVDGVCVHLWGGRWQRASLTTSPAHCHSWDLLSWVLSGGLVNQTVRVIDDADPPTHRVFEVRSGAAGDDIRPTGRLVRHEIAATDEYGTGDRYRLAAGVFHQTLLPDEANMAVTVALGRTMTGAVDLSLGGLDTATHQVRREVYDEPATHELATLARSQVG